MDKENLNGIPEEEIENTAEEIAEETVTESEETSVTEPESEEEAAQEENDEDAEQENVSEETEIDGEESEEISQEEISDEDIPEDELCPVCGERRKQEDSEYCAKCETAMLRRKIPLGAWLSGLASLGFGFLAFVMVLLISAPSLQVAKGDILAKNNCWYSAYNAYSEVSAVAEEINHYLGNGSIFVQTGMGVNERIVKSISEYKSPIEAYAAAGTLMANTDLTKIPFMQEYIKVSEEHDAVYYALEETINELFEEGAVAEEIYAQMNAAKENKELNEVYIDYYIFAAASYFTQEPAVLIEKLDALDKTAKADGGDYSWLYYMPFAEILTEAGEYERAEAILDEIIANDKSNYDAYELKLTTLIEKGDKEAAKELVEQFKLNNEGLDTAFTLEIKYLRCTGEIDKAKALCAEAAQLYGTSPEIFRQYALVYLLEGDYKQAYKMAYTADTNAYYLAYMGDSEAYNDIGLISTVYLSAYLYQASGEVADDDVSMVETILSSIGDISVSEVTLDIINGEKTVNEVLTEGACDLR